MNKEEFKTTILRQIKTPKSAIHTLILGLQFEDRYFIDCMHGEVLYHCSEFNMMVRFLPQVATGGKPYIEVNFMEYPTETSSTAGYADLSDPTFFDNVYHVESVELVRDTYKFELKRMAIKHKGYEFYIEHFPPVETLEFDLRTGELNVPDARPIINAWRRLRWLPKPYEDGYMEYIYDARVESVFRKQMTSANLSSEYINAILASFWNRKSSVDESIMEQMLNSLLELRQ